MAPAGARRVRRARRRVQGAPAAGERARSAEDWWWDRLAPSGSGFHLLQADSMLLVLPGAGPARARTHRRAARRAQPLPPPGARAAGAKARHRPAPTAAPASAPPQGPDPGWGDRIPLEILLQIFGLLVAADGPMPFLSRYLGSVERGGPVATEWGAEARASERTHLCPEAVSSGPFRAPRA